MTPSIWDDYWIERERDGDGEREREREREGAYILREYSISEVSFSTVFE